MEYGDHIIECIVNDIENISERERERKLFSFLDSVIDDHFHHSPFLRDILRNSLRSELIRNIKQHTRYISGDKTICLNNDFLFPMSSSKIKGSVQLNEIDRGNIYILVPRDILLIISKNI
jgi:hypothetical protein